MIQGLLDNILGNLKSFELKDQVIFFSENMKLVIQIMQLLSLMIKTQENIIYTFLQVGSDFDQFLNKMFEFNLIVISFENYFPDHKANLVEFLVEFVQKFNYVMIYQFEHRLICQFLQISLGIVINEIITMQSREQLVKESCLVEDVSKAIRVFANFFLEEKLIIKNNKEKLGTVVALQDSFHHICEVFLQKYLSLLGSIKFVKNSFQRYIEIIYFVISLLNEDQQKILFVKHSADTPI